MFQKSEEPKKFHYPKVFEQYLCLTDEALQHQVLQESQYVREQEVVEQAEKIEETKQKWEKQQALLAKSNKAKRAASKKTR